jgi:hypothetical protein
MATESEGERVNRELIELLNELRVALPGVQILFAFLLAVPFQQRFRQISSFERDTYFVTLLCALVATTLLIAPSALHRLNFRLRDKSDIVVLSNRLAIAGLAVLAIAMVGIIVVIANFLFGTVVAATSATISGGLFAALWLMLPLRVRARAQRDDRRDARPGIRE